MPLYEYRCEKCSHLFEELVSTHHNQILPCPSCGSENTTKQMSAVGGIAMGKSSSAPSCTTGGGCADAGSCCSAGGGCPHGM
ncbi:MAG: FmdB family zinc ribbon protein [Chitinispirillaceae bacterium]